MIKQYNRFINEGLKDYLMGPSEEEVWNELKKLNPYEILRKSAKIGFLKGIEYALENGADIHDGYDIALRSSCENSHLEIVKYLIEHGADVDAWDGQPLAQASFSGHLKIVKYLIEHGANINIEDDIALRYASYNNHFNIIKYLIEHGANIHAQEDKALRNAVENGKLDIVKYLIEHGANIHTQHDVVLKTAKYNRNNELFRYLEEQIEKEKLTEGLKDYLKGPTDEEIWNSVKDETDYEIFFDKFKNIEMTPHFYKLAKNKIESFLSLKHPGEQLRKYSAMGLLDKVKEISQNKEIRILDYGVSLCNASIYGHYDIVKFLLTETVVDIHQLEDGAIRFASSNGHLDIVKILIEYGANIHRQDDVSLRIASRKGHYDVVKVLLENGANVLTKDKRHYNPIQEAERNGHFNIVKLLKKYV